MKLEMFQMSSDGLPRCGTSETLHTVTCLCLPEMFQHSLTQC